MFVSKKKYEKLRSLTVNYIDRIEYLENELKEARGEEHVTSPLCVGCVNCIETGEGYFSHGLRFSEYECKLNRTCKDFEEVKTDGEIH